MKNLILAARVRDTIYYSSRHSHKAWEFIYYAQGNGTLLYKDDLSFNFSPGDIAIIPPDLPHYETTEAGYLNYIIMFNYSDRDPSTIHFYRDLNNDVFTLVNSLCSQLSSSRPNSLNINEATLNLIEQHLVSFDMEKIEYKHSHVITQSINVMTSRFSSPHFHLQELIKNIPYSESYFRKLFKKETGISPAKYLNDLRIDFAKQLLAESTLSVKEISYMSGFSDPFYFSRQFKATCDVSPREYRSSMLKIHENSSIYPETMDALMPQYSDITTYDTVL